MDEYFFIHKGNSTYEIGNEILELKPGDFSRIPYSAYHKLKVENSMQNWNFFISI